MKIRVVNHYLIQEGDTYGLIYALLLNAELKVGDLDLYSFFWVNSDEYHTKGNGYRERVQRRLDYFRSFALYKSRVKLVQCFFTDSPGIEIEAITESVIFVRADKKLFPTGNVRQVGITLTDGADYDPSYFLTGIKKKYPNEVTGWQQAFTSQVLTMFRRHYEVALGPSTQLKSKPELKFLYISKSTDYVLKCSNEHGYFKTTSCLRSLVMKHSSEYTDTSRQFLQKFMGNLIDKYMDDKAKKKHYSSFKDLDLRKSKNFLIVLFWVRGAKETEQSAILGQGKDSVGKPQHHTNMTLYKYARFLIRNLSEETGKPIIFVPIGDRLTELSGDGGKTFDYAKEPKDYNLIEFFRRPAFKGKPMGAQMNFLLQLAEEYPVVQVGMRSGSLERLMYLGIPTIYFDRTKTVDENEQAPIGAARIRQLCGFDGESQVELVKYLLTFVDRFWNTPQRFPLFFHIENRDTGFLKYTELQQTKVENKITELLKSATIDLEEFNDFKRSLLEKNALRNTVSNFSKFVITGGLAEEEVLKLKTMLWFITKVYPSYAAEYRQQKVDRTKDLDGVDPFAKAFLSLRQKIEQDTQQKKDDRKLISEIEVDLEGTFFDD